MPSPSGNSARAVGGCAFGAQMQRLVPILDLELRDLMAAHQLEDTLEVREVLVAGSEARQAGPGGRPTRLSALLACRLGIVLEIRPFYAFLKIKLP